VSATAQTPGAASKAPVAIRAPLSEPAIAELHAGDEVEISGEVFVARDAAHRRFNEILDRGEALPFDLKGQILYYMGPTPAPVGRPIGSAGPTTAGRIDIYTPRLLALGLKGMIGKGNRSLAVRAAMQQYRAVYFVAIGGAGALLSQFIHSSEIIAYEELGAESVRRLQVVRFPAIVGNDIYGGDVFELGKQAYRTAGASR
jgi:fumarate hydratase subunit beta